jgi:hypothetical protein
LRDEVGERRDQLGVDAFGRTDVEAHAPGRYPSRGYGGVMAQRREKRNQRRRTATAPAARQHDVRRRNLKRIVIVLGVLIGLAGILLVTAPGGDDEPSGRAPIG